MNGNGLNRQTSASKVILMCGPAGSGKSTLARTFQQSGMLILSYDEESYRRGYHAHPLPDHVLQEIKHQLDEQLMLLIGQNRDIVLDYSFWSKEMRAEYLTLLRGYGIEPQIYYVKTPKEMAMQRLANRKGSHPHDIVLSKETASLYYDHFQPPTADEGEVITVEGYRKEQ